MWCATIISSFIIGATPLEVQEATVEEEDKSATPSNILIKKKYILIGEVDSLFLS